MLRKIAFVSVLPCLIVACGEEAGPDGGLGGGGTQASGGSSSGGDQSGSGGAPASGGALTGGSSTGGGDGSGGLNGWRLIWADEFDGPGIDASKWEHEVNCWGGGNNEDQCYVTDAKNSFVEGGMLHVRALKDNPSGALNPPWDSSTVTKGHSSARLRTRQKGDWKYGRFEARIKVPFGQGLWPAFWMLPTDNVYGGWARSGEIDIMEAVNASPGFGNLVHGTLHYGDNWPGNVHTGTSYQPGSFIGETFYVYAVEWQEGEIRWFVDDVHFATQRNWYTAADASFPAPFDQRFHLILNVAVGGDWPGYPDGSTTFPQEMVVDYVRVYTCDADPDTGRGCGTSDPNVRPLPG